mmetsp:Transcript_11771/g.37459  ORF Transcript_11771/g.37459 Transcript_11771/m.37459 type:complete len:211 (-) Transcript_11771:11-643(-)
MLVHRRRDRAQLQGFRRLRRRALGIPVGARPRKTLRSPHAPQSRGRFRPHYWRPRRLPSQQATQSQIRFAHLTALDALSRYEAVLQRHLTSSRAHRSALSPLFVSIWWIGDFSALLRCRSRRFRRETSGRVHPTSPADALLRDISRLRGPSRRMPLDSNPTPPSVQGRGRAAVLFDPRHFALRSPSRSSPSQLRAREARPLMIIRVFKPC